MFLQFIDLCEFRYPVYKNIPFYIIIIPVTTAMIISGPDCIWHFDQILEHLLHLGQKCITMETRNLQYGITRTFPSSIG